MSVIYLLISISIVVAVGFLYAFLRAVKTGQYDDDYTPSVRMLFDDELVKKIPKMEIPPEPKVNGAKLNSKTEKIKTRIKTKTI
jgi:cbb3-type cytochrome oxidase maturation protein